MKPPLQTVNRFIQSRVSACIAAVIMAVGCKSEPLGPYVSPRVVGQVVAGTSSQPLAGVRVWRGSTRITDRTGSLLKGGELLMQKSPALTDINGRFALPSERVLSVFRGSGWSTVSLAFDRAGFRHFQTNYPIALATNTPEGEPVLDVGVVRLREL